MSVFRVMSLFLENKMNTDVKELMQQHLVRIPSYKYVTILPQLVPHITPKQDEEFGGQVTSVVLRCAKEHPHHTLPLILALINANKDREYCDSTTKTDCNEIRLNGANFLISKLKEDVRLERLIQNMLNVSDAIIELAYVPTIKSPENRQNNIPRGCKIRKLKHVEDVLIPTVSLPVNKSGNYSDIIGTNFFGNVFPSLVHCCFI